MKVLVVGLGSVGQRHVRNLRTLLGSSVEILACRTRGWEVASAYGVRSFSDLDQALAERPDATFVCNPTALHLTTALAAAAADSHLFVEKPLADRWEGVEALTALVDARRLVAVVGFQMRFHPCFSELVRLLDARAVGPIVSVRAAIGEHLPSWHPGEDYRQSYAARRDLGGGAILSQTHEFDYLTALFGRPRRVFTLGGHLTRLDVDVEDVASTLMEVEVDGRPIPVHLHQDYVQRPGTRSCEIVGEDGRLLADFNAVTVTHVGPQGQVAHQFRCETFERNHMFLAEVQHFLACIRGEETPRVDLRAGAGSLRVALAAAQSLETGQVVCV